MRYSREGRGERDRVKVEEKKMHRGRRKIKKGES